MTRAEFEKKWLKTFVPRLTKEQYDSCYLHQFLWHAFSYGLVPKEAVLTGDAARQAYLDAEKEGAIAIRLDVKKDEQTVPLPEKYKSLKTMEKYPEFYVVGQDWAWTYVSTHENGWYGPYFYKAPAKLTWEDYQAR